MNTSARAAALTPDARSALIHDVTACSQSLRALLVRLVQSAPTTPAEVPQGRALVRFNRVTSIPGAGTWAAGETASLRREVFEHVKRMVPDFFVVDGVERPVLEIVTAEQLAAEHPALPLTSERVLVRILIPTTIPTRLDGRTASFSPGEIVALDPDVVAWLEKPRFRGGAIGLFRGTDPDGTPIRVFERLPAAEVAALKAAHAARAASAEAATAIGVGDVDVARALVALFKRHGVFVDVAAPTTGAIDREKSGDGGRK